MVQIESAVGLAVELLDVEFILQKNSKQIKYVNVFNDII